MNKFAVAAIGLTVTLGVGLVLLFNLSWGAPSVDVAETTVQSTSTTGAATNTTSVLETTTSVSVEATTTTTSSPTTTTAPTTTSSAPTSTTQSTTLPPTTTSTVPPPPFSVISSTPTSADLSDSWHEGCPVAVADLRILTLTHWGYDGRVRTGKLVVAANQVGAIAQVFEAMYDAQFPIERMELIEEYGGSDNASMAANNTSAFNCRAVTGGTAFSEHSYGRAIDINPLVNPYVNGSTILPPAGAAYLDRSQNVTGMIHAGDAVVTAFKQVGWIWGGTWTSLKDYQHFSSTGN
jgi:D-alanyl-D-alanine carboxypeptidase